jgi:hypothetical protein
MVRRAHHERSQEGSCDVPTTAIVIDIGKSPTHALSHVLGPHICCLLAKPPAIMR